MIYRAALVEDFVALTFRLYVARDVGVGGGRQDLLMADGTWRTVDIGVRLEDEVGLPFPLDAADAVLDAFKRFKGDMLDSATESKVLRQWLEKETERVDRLLGVTEASLGSQRSE